MGAGKWLHTRRRRILRADSIEGFPTFLSDGERTVLPLSDVVQGDLDDLQRAC